MPRSLLPSVLALLLAPAAMAAPADPGAPGADEQADALHASRGEKRGGGGGDKGSRGGRSGSSQNKGGSHDKGGSRDQGRDSGSRDSRSTDHDRESAERRDGPYASERRDDGARQGDGAERRDAPTARPSDARPRDGGAIRPSEGWSPASRSDSAGPGSRSPMDGRSVHGAAGARPTPVQPSVRKVSVGGAAPTRASGAPASARGSVTPANTPANFRSSVGHDRRDAASHASAERHGDRGSDAVRATHGSHGASDAHRAGTRHARSTAAYHRSAAAYHRSATSRHRAWASARAHRYHRWYSPGGWFAPWRPGHASWYHGVFVYGPSPWHHHDHGYAAEGGSSGAGDAGEASSGPRRAVDRTRTFAVGLRGGSYLGAYDFGGGGFGDAGLGLAVRYRPVEAVGLELSWMHHDQTWDEGTERAYQPLQASVELFAAPWTRVNPYVLAGVTVASRQVHDDVGFTQVDEASTLWGPHAGLGIEFNVGQKASINFDARYAGYLNKPEGDLTIPGAFQANMGLNFYF